MLTLTNGNTDVSSADITAVVQGGSPLTDGDTVTLITNSNGLTTDDATTYGKLTEGVSLDYDLTVSKSGNSIIATIGTSSDTSGELKSETESLPLSSGD